MQLLVLNVSRPQACSFRRVIPEIDIWRAANLMLKRYGDKALEESATRADELAAAGDHDGARHLAPDHRRRRPAREHNTARPAALTGKGRGRPAGIDALAPDRRRVAFITRVFPAVPPQLRTQFQENTNKVGDQTMLSVSLSSE